MLAAPVLLLPRNDERRPGGRRRRRYSKLDTAIVARTQGLEGRIVQWEDDAGDEREGVVRDVAFRAFLEQVRSAFYLLVEREDGRLVTVRAERVTVVRK